jgi:PIN domain nuclease of toxin-antitoxin system
VTRAVLADTHSFLWFITEDARLSATARQAMQPGERQVWLSVASLWEIAIKVSIGRLPLPEPFAAFIRDQMDENAIDLLPIAPAHAFEVARLPFHHRDPFDRMIIAQAAREGLPIVSVDAAFDAYAVERIW